MKAVKKNLLPLVFMILIAACGGDSSSDEPVIVKDYLKVPPSIELSAEGQATDITIDANCNWTISKDADDASWLTINPTSGSNKQSVTVSAMKNSTGADRMAILSVQGGSLPPKKITVMQPKIIETLTLSVNTKALIFEKDGGNQHIVIASNTNWNITCPDWCSLSAATGQGSATITITASKNTKTETRTGQITVNGNGVSSVYIDVTQQPADKNENEPGPGDNLPPTS